MAEGWKRKGLIRAEGIPPPTGKYGVGCVDILADLEADETKGGLLIRLHYPTNASPEQFPYPAVFHNKRCINGILDMTKPKFPGLTFTLMNNLTDPRVPALLGAPLLPAESSDSGGEGGSANTPPYPVVVFSHGYRAWRSVYSGILCDLASHGYVAVSMDHSGDEGEGIYFYNGSSFKANGADGREEGSKGTESRLGPGSGSCSACLKRLPKSNGREGELEDNWWPYQGEVLEKPNRDEILRKMVKQNVGDLRLTLDFLRLLNDGSQVKDLLRGTYDFSQFKGRLDVSKTAIMGHSLGGAAVVTALTEDPRFKCGIALDTYMPAVTTEAMSGEVRQPLYLINCTHLMQFKENVQMMVPLCREPDDTGMTTHRILTLNNTTHFTQSDVYFTIPKFFRGQIEDSILDDTEGHLLNLDICHAFLKRHLLQDPDFQGPVPNLDGDGGHSPHIIFGSNFDLSDDSNNGPDEESRNEAGGGAEGDSPEDGAEATVSSEMEEDKKESTEE